MNCLSIKKAYLLYKRKWGNKTMDDKIQNIIHLIKESPLDPTIQEILIRDLQNEGLTDFMREQIRAYCLEGIKILDEKIAAAKKHLEEDKQNPSV